MGELLWGGRFSKGVNADVNRFNACLLYGSRVYREDIEGSRAHVRMLAKQQILTDEERDQILAALDAIEDDLSNGRIELTIERYEDIHTLVEAQLTERIGAVGKKLHTGRSRNDQSCVDLKLYCRHQAQEIRALLVQWIAALTETMSQHLDTFMPGFTHLQKAQPVTLALHLGAYAEMALRDVQRLDDCVKHFNMCPLGAAALAGTTYPLDRAYTAELLGFDGPTRNSMDSVSDRDHVCELIYVASMVMMHLSRFSEEAIMWCSDEYRFMEMDDAYSTGSSIMPQKKNPDVSELIRGKTGRVYGDFTTIMTVLKGLPLTYNKDLQEDKEALFDAIDTVKDCLSISAQILMTATFHKEAMERSAGGGFTNATDVADYLVKHGMPFRDAHTVSGQLVLACIERGCDLCSLPLSVYKEHSELFEADIYEEISVRACVLKRRTFGGPAPEQVAENVAFYRSWLAAQE